MAEYLIQSESLDNIADAINAKTGGSSAMTPAEMVTAIGGIEKGYSPSEIAKASTAYGDIVVSGSIANYAFYGRTGITSVVKTGSGTIGEHAFQYCSGLKTVTVESGNLGSGAFQNCPELTKVTALKSSCSDNVFNTTSKLVHLVFPYITDVYTATFLTHTLTGLDLGDDTHQVNLIRASCVGSSRLSTLVIRSSGVASLYDLAAFYSSGPFRKSGTTAKLYVKQELIEQYLEATNWSTLLAISGNSILPIEGSIYETQYVDGTPIPSE